MENSYVEVISPIVLIQRCEQTIEETVQKRKDLEQERFTTKDRSLINLVPLTVAIDTLLENEQKLEKFLGCFKMVEETKGKLSLTIDDYIFILKGV